MEIENLEGLLAYESYAETWLVPIGYPLLLAVVAQAAVYADLGLQCSRQRRPRAAAVEAPVLLLLAAETIFAVFCLSQCLVNFLGPKTFVGGAGACGLQGLYSGYYLLAAPALAGLATLALAEPVADEVSRLRRVAAAGGLIHALAFGVAALPLLGAGRYRFARDYCMPDLETPLFAALCLPWWAAAAAMTIVGCLSLSRSAPRLAAVVAGYFLAAWSVPAAVVLVYAGGGSATAVCCLGSMRLYGVLAMTMHTNQLAVPLIWGWKLRLAAYEARVPGALDKADAAAIL